MLSQQQNNLHWPEEETPPALDQKPTVTSASSWRGWSLWLRILGGVVALGVGFAFPFPINIPIPLEVFLLVPVLVGVVSAGLLRSWWAMLIVPVAFSIGFFLSNVFFLGGSILPDVSDPGFVEGTGILVGLGVVPLAIGVAIGIPLGKWIERRLQH